MKTGVLSFLVLLPWSVIGFCLQRSPSNFLFAKIQAPTSRLRLRARPDPHLPNFCSECGSDQMVIKIPPGDERPRAVCSACGAVVYSNPKVVVSCVILSSNNQCLLAKRSIEPRKGYWGIPQGFMEHGETTREAAVREVWEETGATVQANDLVFRALYNVPGSVQLVYQGKVSGDLTVATKTTESSEIGFFDISDLPDLCFPTVEWAINHCVSDSSRIQQKTKFYQAETDQWGEFEDEAP